MKHHLNVKFVVTVVELCRKFVPEDITVSSLVRLQAFSVRWSRGRARGARRAWALSLSQSRAMARALLVALWCAAATTVGLHARSVARLPP